MDSSQHVEDLQIGEGSSQATNEASSNTIIQIRDDSSQDHKDATQQPTAIRNRDRSSSHANDSTPPATDVHTKLEDVSGKLNCGSICWYKKRIMMNKRDENGMCPVHLAAKEGYHHIIEEFMRLIPNCVDIRSKDGKTALHFAVENNQLEVVKTILLNKDVIYVRKMVSQDSDKDCNTALHLAAIHDVDTQIVRELLKLRGVNVHALNKEGLTALDIAAHSSNILSQDDRRSKCAQIKTILEAVGGSGRYSRQSEGKEGKIVDVETVVASLIATITFAAIFQIPGGIEDDPKSSLYGGARKLLKAAFFCFSIFNSAALFTSLTVVIAWLHRQRFRTEQLYEYRSGMADVSGILLETSIVCTGLAFLCAYFLIITPSDTSVSHNDAFSFGRYFLLVWGVVGAACFAPAIWWSRVLVMMISRVYTYVFTRKPNPALFTKSVLCTWFVIGVVMPLIMMSAFSVLEIV